MDKQTILDLLYLEKILISRIHECILELLRGKEFNRENFKNSLNYQIEEILKIR